MHNKGDHVIPSLQVKIDNVFLLLDCTFGSGHTSSSSGGVSYTPDYFAVPPQHLILTHWPTDPSYQFLESSLSLQEINGVLPVPATTLKQGIVPLTWSKRLTVPEYFPVVSVDVCVENESTKLSAELVPGPDAELTDASYEQNVLVTKKEKKWNIQAATPLKEQYSLNIYSQQPNSAESTNKLCLSYVIQSERDAELKLGYPKLNESVLPTYDFDLIHWNSPAQSYVCQNLSGSLNLVFEAKPNIDFDQYTVPGRVANPDSLPEESKKRYNTMLLRNTGPNKSLYQLQAVFPSNGWWTVSIYGADPGNTEHMSWKYNCLLNYYVYVTAGLPRNTYPRILSPDISFNGIKPISATGNEQFSLQFAASKHLTCSHYLVFDEKETFKGFTKVDFCGKMKSKERFVYNLRVIFPWPGSWHVHVLGKEKDKGQDISLFKLNITVNGALKNTSFVDCDSAIAEALGVEVLNDGLLTFEEDTQPLRYSFKALPDVNIHHSLKFQESDGSSKDYSTHLSSEPCADVEPGPSRTMHTIHAVFPSSGKWSLQLYAGEEGCSNFSLVITLNVNIQKPCLQLCYPKISTAFHQLKMSIESDKALIQKNCENGEFKLPFAAHEENFFTWNVELISSGEKFPSNAFVYFNPTESSNRLLHVIFPKPGEWLIRLFAKQTSSPANKSGNFRSVLELRLNSLSFKSGIHFPQVFEQFYSNFKLQLDPTQLPLISEVNQVPTKIVIPIYSPDGDVQFWHDVDVKVDSSEEGEDNQTFNKEDQCKMISDPASGRHELAMEVDSKGQWTVSLFARRSNSADKSWVTILKHSIASM